MGNYHIEKLKLSIPILISKPKISYWLAMIENHSQCFEKMNNLITIDYSIIPLSNTEEDQLINSVNFTAIKNQVKLAFIPNLLKNILKVSLKY